MTQHNPHTDAAQSGDGASQNERKMIAISSGKGGVGKSTVTANIAVAMARMGLRVGVVDADIYGPSIPGMLGISGNRPPACPGWSSFNPKRHTTEALNPN